MAQVSGDCDRNRENRCAIFGPKVESDDEGHHRVRHSSPERRVPLGFQLIRLPLDADRRAESMTFQYNGPTLSDNAIKFRSRRHGIKYGRHVST